jgi:hypothetical protein
MPDIISSGLSDSTVAVALIAMVTAVELCGALEITPND